MRLEHNDQTYLSAGYWFKLLGCSLITMIVLFIGGVAQVDAQSPILSLQPTSSRYRSQFLF